MLAQAIYTLFLNGSIGDTRRRGCHRAWERARIDSEGRTCGRVGVGDPLVNVLLGRRDVLPKLKVFRTIAPSAAPVDCRVST